MNKKKVENRREKSESENTAEVKALLDNITIILVRPKYPENIGAAARSARNMGISQLMVVSQDMHDIEKVRKMATHHAAEIVDTLSFFPDLPAALQSFSHVIATTARHGRQRRTTKTPRQLAKTLPPILKNNRTAILFGREDRGLSNEDVKFAHQTVTIPTADFSSLNLAQAVAVISYEIYTALLETLQQGPVHFFPRQAISKELEGMYTHLEEALCCIGFLHDDEHEYWMRNIRQFFGRLQLQARDVRLIRGICRQLLWHDKQCRSGNFEKE